MHGAATMSQGPKVAYRPMPLWYIGAWILLFGPYIVWRQAAEYGWASLLSPGVLAETVSTVVIGALLVGWIFWRFVGLYERFPPRAPR